MTYGAPGAVRWATVSAFPSPVIRSARLELREYEASDAGLVLRLLAGGEPEALPPGAPSDPAAVDGWLADDASRGRRAPACT